MRYGRSPEAEVARHPDRGDDMKFANVFRARKGRNLLLLAGLLATGVGIAAINQLGKPSLSLDDATPTSIDVKFTAGTPGGAPAGFSLQWMSADDHDANGGWFLSNDARLCKASLSGVPGYNQGNLNRYSLAAGESATVTIGDILLDQGASTNCDRNLQCDTEYVFRAFSHTQPGKNGLKRSEFSNDLVAATLACDGTEGCFLSQGYWKTHGPVPTGNNTNQWLVDNLTLGTVNYTDTQLLAILNQQPQGNGLVALAHQLIAVKLSIASGADGTDIQGAVAAADALIGGRVVPPVGSGTLAPSATNGLVSALDEYIHLHHCE